MIRALAILALGLLAAAAHADDGPAVDTRVHAFYYGWYASPEFDGLEAHWNHAVLGDTIGRVYPGGADIGANYYPALGAYSSHDPKIVIKHVAQMRSAGIGVIVASWWGAGGFEDRGLPLLLDVAAEAGLEVAFHLEPLPGRDAATSGEALRYLVDTYGNHLACHRRDGRPVVYVYDSYLTPAADWARLLQPDGEITIRGTDHDCVVIGLWVGRDEGSFFTDGGFDGFYTYFAADGFTWGASRDNWPILAAFAADHDLLFVPCVGPGYLDTRVRPWNGATTRGRENGAYYDRQFEAALAVDPPLIGITSFNEWHEGTQIEPALPFVGSGFAYRDYRPREPGWYLERTRWWIDRWQEERGR